MNIKLEWNAQVTDILGKQIRFKSEEGSMGRIIFENEMLHDFKENSIIRISLEMATEPTPANTYERRRTIIYGKIHDVVVNGIVIGKWTKKHIIFGRMWRELAIIIDEKTLSKCPFFQGDTVKLKVANYNSTTTQGIKNNNV